MKIKYAWDYFKYLSNPFQALLFKFGFKKSCKLIVKNSEYNPIIKNEDSLNKLMKYIPLVSNDKINEYLKYMEDIDNDFDQISVGGINYINVYSSNFKKNASFDYAICIEEYFYGDDWDMIDYSGRHVVDIGGNNGDTALYFAKHGANVIGFEPVKHLYDLALENIDLNPDLKNNITFVNKAVGGSRGILKINAQSVKDYIDKDVYEMEVITLKDVIKNYDFTPDILKMDCEGCEFEIIKNGEWDMFNDIILEHHSLLTGKDYNDIINLLKEKGYKIDRFSVAEYSFDEIGLIHAYKV